MTVWQIFRDFSAWTSAHGIPHIGGAQNACLRVFWTIIFTVSVGMFTWQMVLLIQKYLQYDVTVQTELMFQERSFPAVTICNLNPYVEDIVQTDTGTISAPGMQDLLDQYDKALNGSSTESFFIGLNDSIAIQAKAKDILMFMMYQKGKDIQENFYYKKKEFVVNCAYNTKPCDIENDFIEIIDPVYGKCFQFNNQPKPKYNSTRAGPLYGLRVLLKSNQSQYISLTESAGVRVAIHGQQEPPFPDAFGYNAAAGFTTSFGIQFIQTERLPAPYGNCTKTFPSNIPYYYPTGNGLPYSTEACFRSCLQNQVASTCGCADPSYLKSNDVNYCPVDKYGCVANLTGNTGGSSVSVESCSCQQPCSESSYGVTVSTALWPSEVYVPPDCQSSNSAEEKACQKWYSENTMLVEVYYERMNYQLLSEQEAYLLVNLISDMGGQLGLWMGFSVITMIEFIALFVLLIIYCCSKHQKQPDAVHPLSEEETKKQELNSFNATAHEPPAYSESDPAKVESQLHEPEQVARNRPVSVRSLAK